MPYEDWDGSIWTHERDYGGNPFPDLLIAICQITVGIVLLIVALFRKK